MLNPHRDTLLSLGQLTADVGNLLACYGLLVLQGLLQHTDFVLFGPKLALAQLLNLLYFYLMHPLSLLCIVEGPISLRLSHLDILLELLHNLEEPLDLLKVFLRLHSVSEMLICQEGALKELANRTLMLLQLIEVVVVRAFL